MGWEALGRASVLCCDTSLVEVVLSRPLPPNIEQIYETDETSLLNKLKLPGSSRKFLSPLGLLYNCLF